MAKTFDEAQSLIGRALENPTENHVVEILQMISVESDNPLETQFLTADVARCLDGLDRNDDEIIAEEQEIIAECYSQLGAIVAGVSIKVRNGSSPPMQPIIADPLSDGAKSMLRGFLSSGDTEGIEGLKEQFPLQALTIQSVVGEYERKKDREQALSVPPPFDLTPGQTTERGSESTVLVPTSSDMDQDKGRDFICRMDIHVGDSIATRSLNGTVTIDKMSKELHGHEVVYLVPATTDGGDKTGMVEFTYDSVNWLDPQDLFRSDGNPSTFKRNSAIYIIPLSMLGDIPATQDNKIRWAHEQGLISDAVSEVPDEVERYFPETPLVHTTGEPVSYAIRLPKDQSYLVWVQAGERNDPNHPRDPHDNFNLSLTSQDFHALTENPTIKTDPPEPCPDVDLARPVYIQREEEKELSPVQFSLKGDLGLYFAEHYPAYGSMDAGFRFFLGQEKIWFLRPGFGGNMFGYYENDVSNTLLLTPRLHVGGGFRLSEPDFVVMFDSALWVVERTEIIYSEIDGEVNRKVTERNLDLDLGLLASYKGMGVFTGYRLDKGFHVGLVLERTLDIPPPKRLK